MSYCCELSELKAFVKNATPNTKFIYYSGFSLTDTIMSKELKKVTFDHATRGEVYLVQQRVGMQFDFIVIKASKIPIYKLIPSREDKPVKFYTPREGKVRRYEYRAD